MPLFGMATKGKTTPPGDQNVWTPEPGFARREAHKTQEPPEVTTTAGGS